MSKREHFPSGVPCWVETLQPDPDAAARFYARLFGWEPEDGGGYVLARLRGRDVAGVAPLPPMVDPPPAPGWATHVRVDDVHAAGERVRAAGGTVVLDAFDAAPAGRLGVMADPAGAVFCVWEAGVREGAQVVNEPGAWSMSALTTPDPGGAAAFYCAVFGWTTETFSVGELS